MSSFTLQTPVLLLIFNRPETTERVFQEIRKARPPHLFISADGPRPEVAGDRERCLAAREIASRVDWDCQVHTNFRDRNWGCKQAVGSGITWFFEHVPEGIVLEDDTLPHPSFFRFCQELLHHYRHDERVMMISGDNFQCGRRRTAYSYYFSRHTHIWGWASWRRAWHHYDGDMRLWPEMQQGGWLKEHLPRRAAGLWTKIFNLTYRGEINTWDFQWTFACWVQHGLVILPQVNLVSNIGFAGDPTHSQGNYRLADMAVAPMGFPLVHPPYLLADRRADSFTDQIVFGDRSLTARAWRRVQRLCAARRNYFRESPDITGKLY